MIFPFVLAVCKSPYFFVCIPSVSLPPAHSLSTSVYHSYSLFSSIYYYYYSPCYLCICFVCTCLVCCSVSVFSLSISPSLLLLSLFSPLMAVCPLSFLSYNIFNFVVIINLNNSVMSSVVL